MTKKRWGDWASLPEALLESIWQQPHRPLDVAPTLSRLLLFCTELCSCPHSTGEPFHSLLVLGHRVPMEKKTCYIVRILRHGLCAQNKSFLCPKLTLHVQWVDSGKGVVCCFSSLKTAECFYCHVTWLNTGKHTNRKVGLIFHQFDLLEPSLSHY